jgi:ABC-type amino acid transport system permease subunit
VASDDQQRTALINAFTSIVRQSQLEGVDTQRLSMAFRMTLEALEPGQPVELQSLYDYLVKEQKAPEKSVVELCVILKSREPRLGIQFVPPQQAMMPFLSMDQQDRIVAQFTARENKQYDKSSENKPAAPPAPIPGKAWQPDRSKRDPNARTKALAAGLALVVVLAIAFFSWRQSTLIPAMKTPDVPPVIAGGLTCAIFTSNGNTALCEMHKAALKALPSEAIEAQASIMKTALGVHSLFVISIEEDLIVLIK